MQNHQTIAGLAAVAVLSAVVVVAMAHGERPVSPTLQEILQRLEENARRYEAIVPSFFCDGHVVSDSKGSYSPKISAVIDETFRLSRAVHRDGSVSLDESHEIKTVDGQAWKGEGIPVAMGVTGAFSGGYSLVSASQHPCMRYWMQPIEPHRPYIVEFSTIPAKERPADCLLREDGSGRVFIDPQMFQITRLELTAPHHEMIARKWLELPHGSDLKQILGVWSMSIDYTAVSLETKMFWVPSDIDSTITAGSFGSRTEWKFQAHYENYHKLEVTSHIIPADWEPTPTSHQ